MGGVGVEEQGAHVGCERTEWVGAVHQCMPQDRVEHAGFAWSTELGAHVGREARSATQPILPLLNVQLHAQNGLHSMFPASSCNEHPRNRWLSKPMKEEFILLLLN